MAVGVGGRIQPSSDNGSSWDVRTSGHSSSINKIIFADNTFVAVGERRTTSFDNGTTWSTYGGSSLSLNDIAYGNGSFVTIGPSWTIYRSDNGYSWSTWINRDTSDYSELVSITYGNDIFVIVGEWGRIHTSVDGYSWRIRRYSSDKFGYNSLNDVIYLN